MNHKAWCGLEEVPYCFSKSSLKIQGQITQKLVDFYPNLVFRDYNSSLNSQVVMKWRKKLEVAQ